MSFFGDLLDYERFHAGNMFGKLKDDPERAFIGAFDPFSSAVWGGVTGKDYSPIVDQWGGSTPDDFAKAKAAGINTGPGKTMDSAAHAIASIYAGGYGADKAGGLLGNVGNAGTTAGDMFSAQESGLGSSAYGWGGAQTGTQGTLNSVFGTDAGARAGGLLGTANDIAKPASTAMQAASMFKPEEQPPIQAPQIIPPTASPALGQIVQNNQQAIMNQQQLDAQKRDMRKRRIGLIGGY